MTVRTLGELQSTDEGAAELEARGVYSCADSFVAALGPPERPDLQMALAVQGPLVYVGQQLSVDYASSVVAKLCALRDLAGPDIAPLLLGVDTDRIGSTGSLAVLHWPPDRSIRLVPRRLRAGEIRFAPVSPERLADMFSTLRSWVQEDCPCGDGSEAVERLRSLEAHVQGREPSTLADVSAAVTEHLLRAQLGFSPPMVLSSDLLDGGFLEGPLTAVVAAIDGFVSVYNAAVDRCFAAGIDPVVRRREPDELPLYYSCPADHRRLRLRHVRDGVCRLAVAECRCGAVHRFELGRGEVSLAEITATGRWSTDVTLPVYLNDVTSGVVAGRSSALYGLVMNEVVRDVLGGRPVPIHAPPGTSATSEDSLLVSHLEGA